MTFGAENAIILSMKNSYIEIKNATVREIVIERSRFICRLEKVKTESDARAVIAEVKREHPFATHNCYAYITDGGEISRFSDDGEPQGTAGQPMLEALKGKGLVNVVAVVTRYFGGVKLGAGGLVRAYSGAVSSAARDAGISEFFLSDEYRLTFGYDSYQAFLKYIQKQPITVLSTDFSDSVTACVAIKNQSGDVIDGLVDYLNGKVFFEKTGEGYYIYE